MISLKQNNQNNKTNNKTNNLLQEQIEEAIQVKEEDQQFLDYINMANLGNECDVIMRLLFEKLGLDRKSTFQQFSDRFIEVMAKKSEAEEKIRETYKKSSVGS